MLQTKRRIIRIPPAKAATRIYRYRASLQLFATVNAAGISSCRQIELQSAEGLESILEADSWARRYARQMLD